MNFHAGNCLQFLGLSLSILEEVTFSLPSPLKAQARAPMPAPRPAPIPIPTGPSKVPPIAKDYAAAIIPPAATPAPCAPANTPPATGPAAPSPTAESPAVIPAHVSTPVTTAVVATFLPET